MIKTFEIIPNPLYNTQKFLFIQSVIFGGARDPTQGLKLCKVCALLLSQIFDHSEELKIQ